MRTKHLLLAALASVLVCSAQAQVSLNVVGYVNVTLVSGYTFVANPLKYSTNSWLTNIVVSPPNGTRAYVWDVTNQVFSPTAIYSTALSTWSLNYDLPPGKGFVIFAPVRWTNTFVGEVLQGPLTNFVAGNHKFSLLGSKVPQAGDISLLGFPRLNGADVYFYRTATQTFSNAYTCFDDYGWFDPKGLAGTAGPFCNVAESFFVQNPGPDTNWVRYFIVPRPEQARVSSSTSAAPRISQISVSEKKVTLNIEGSGGAYDVQHSVDRVTWTTLAQNRSGAVWTGVLPAGTIGYFQIIQANGVKEKP